MIATLQRAKRWLLMLLLRKRTFEQPFHNLQQILAAYDTGTEDIPVLCFGDSVMERVSRMDTDTRTLGQMLSAALEPNLGSLCISHSAYNPKVYYHFATVLETTRRRPRIIVLPVNIRCFSPQWDLYPGWQFDDQIRAIQTYLAHPERGVPSISGSTSVPIKSKQRFLDTSVKYVGSDYTRIKEFVDQIAAQADNDTAQTARQKVIFTYHYMHPLDSEHPKLHLLLDTIRQYERLGVRTLLYFTPVNVQAGETLLGQMFSHTVQTNVDTVKQALRSATEIQRVVVRDWAAQFSADEFFHALEPTEHLNQNGRLRLTALIANEIPGCLNDPFANEKASL